MPDKTAPSNDLQTLIHGYSLGLLTAVLGAVLGLSILVIAGVRRGDPGFALLLIAAVCGGGVMATVLMTGWGLIGSACRDQPVYPGPEDHARLAQEADRFAELGLSRGSSGNVPAPDRSAPIAQTKPLPYRGHQPPGTGIAPAPRTKTGRRVDLIA